MTEVFLIESDCQIGRFTFMTKRQQVLGMQQSLEFESTVEEYI
jgi:hypothetical protein